MVAGEIFGIKISGMQYGQSPAVAGADFFIIAGAAGPFEQGGVKLAKCFHNGSVFPDFGKILASYVAGIKNHVFTRTHHTICLNKTPYLAAGA